MTGIERLVDIVNDGPYSGGMIHISVQKLREICEQIEREQDAAVNDSPCDAILTEDREAIAWVRAYGGIEKVKQDALCWNTAEHIAPTTLDWLARVCPVAGIEKCGYGVSLEKLEDVINRRLMPEGMEWLLEVWPKWSNGEYCKFGGWWVAPTYGENEPKPLRTLSIYAPDQLREWGQDEGDNFGYQWDFMRPSDTGYRPDKVEPAPVGADGVPITNDESVYEIGGDGTRLTVVRTPKNGEYQAIVVKSPDGNKTTLDPLRLTHTKPEPPDSWDSVWMDVSNGCETPQGMERRCKVLAERGE